jgi:hypothetical protein
METLARLIREEKEIKCTHIGREELKSIIRFQML